ncbi:hypothetical protein QE392_000200 [Microbacterium proteolyticum]|nr:hypothetical protein [Microbacterium sp. SORGH_AS_0344]MDQ1168396.1 hypothetical protein [Microbacterium proteolyticum]
MADCALVTLSSSLQTGNRDDLETWIDKHSWHYRRRDMDALIHLAELASETVAPDPRTQTWYPDVDDTTTEAALMAGRLVAANLNGDDTAFARLVRAWVEWPPPARADVLRELIGGIVHQAQPGP